MGVFVCMFLPKSIQTRHMVSLNPRVSKIYMLWISASNKEPRWRTRGREPKIKRWNLLETSQHKPNHYDTQLQQSVHYTRHNKLNKRSICHFNKRSKCSICRFSVERQDCARKVALVQHGKVASSFSVKVCTLFYMPITTDLGMRQEMMAPSSKKECLLTVWPTNNFCVPTPFALHVFNL